MSTTPVAIVTGASSGIGLEISRQLIGLGYTVVMAARSEAKLREAAAELGGDPVPTDVADDASVTALIQHARDTHGRIDALINNAGYAPLAPIHEKTPDMVRDILAINTLGPAYAIHAAWPIMRDQSPLAGHPSPCIVNTSSVASRDPFPGLTIYGGAKAAVNIFARGCANEGQEHGIRAFSVAPGAVETPMLRAILDESVLSKEQTLDPAHVAAVSVACVQGKHDDRNGDTIFVESPSVE